MRLKGEMVIELTDTNTGAVETVQETNMITEAVNNIPVSYTHLTLPTILLV